MPREFLEPAAHLFRRHADTRVTHREGDPLARVVPLPRHLEGRSNDRANVERSKTFGPRQGDLAFVAGDERSAPDFDQCRDV